MTQKEKDLLLKDIFGRIPYGIKCSYLDIEFNNTIHGNLESFEYDDDKDVIFVIDGIGIYSERVKPYLFPLSSMTITQRQELDTIVRRKIYREINYHECISQMIDFYHKHHFDYRNLIPIGLANDATGLNIY